MSLYRYWRRFNEELAVQVVALVATMECVYAFAAFVLIPLWFPQTTPFVQYVSSALLQLTFLPLILVAQEVANRRERAHAEAEHRAIMKELKSLKTLIVNMSKDSTHAS